jgi:hypothetical protein
MGHGFRKYIVQELNGLRGFGQIQGLDKITEPAKHEAGVRCKMRSELGFSDILIRFT